MNLISIPRSARKFSAASALLTTADAGSALIAALYRFTTSGRWRDFDCLDVRRRFGKFRIPRLDFFVDRNIVIFQSLARSAKLDMVLPCILPLDVLWLQSSQKGFGFPETLEEINPRLPVAPGRSRVTRGSCWSSESESGQAARATMIVTCVTFHVQVSPGPFRVI